MKCIYCLKDSDVTFRGVEHVIPEAFGTFGSNTPTLDLSDAFQLLSLQAGYFSHLIGGSRTVLVTADGALARAARQRNLPVWDCMREPLPGQ
jgi:hypothetical protein